jgi:hypothetical protein
LINQNKDPYERDRGSVLCTDELVCILGVRKIVERSCNSPGLA